MVLEIVISESTIRIVGIIILILCFLLALIVNYKINPVNTIMFIIILIAFAVVWFISWLWGTYITPLYYITVVP